MRSEELNEFPGPLGLLFQPDMGALMWALKWLTVATPAHPPVH